MSDNAESPAELQKEEPQPASEDSTTNDQKKKIDLLLKAVGDTPIMKQKKWAVERGRTVQSLSQFISRFLKLDAGEQLFIYVNQSFAPSPDQDVGVLFDLSLLDGLLSVISVLVQPFCNVIYLYLTYISVSHIPFFQCFGSDGKLVLHYCKSQAWG
ncbi:Ubiquitin-like protein ATG12 [Takifugu flavidus]|uniref:Ubiquitin-like protein ATG12 n=1 Tax=Takifugu flavidus TaxID=433684 RepID=A0A5C6PID8_9TELE|nr:Ubiquitin-like protein ATG12 [Takifugu flavidus]